MDDYVLNSEVTLEEQDIYNLSEFFKVFGDPTRIKILCSLYRGEKCVQDISEDIGLSQSAVSHQLKILRDLRLVKFSRSGKSVIYSLDDNHIFSIITQGIQHIGE